MRALLQEFSPALTFALYKTPQNRQRAHSCAFRACPAAHLTFAAVACCSQLVRKAASIEREKEGTL
jgi:hypothetical protein